MHELKSISDVLKNKKIVKNNSARPINENFEIAREFASYVGLSTFFILRMFKIYGRARVLSIRSWLKDCPHDRKRYAGLVVWKLKEIQKHDNN